MKQWGTEASFDSPWADRSAVSNTWRISSCFQHPRFYNPMGALKSYQYQKSKVVLQPSFFKDCWWTCGADFKVWAWFENMEYFISWFLLRFKMLWSCPCTCGKMSMQCHTRAKGEAMWNYQWLLKEKPGNHIALNWPAPSRPSSCDQSLWLTDLNRPLLSFTYE